MLPVPWIAVGVTGHRHPRLPIENASAVEQAIERCLVRIRDEAAKRVAGDDDCLADAKLQCRLVTSLAEGSDTLAVSAALSAGYRIDACLPFDRERRTWARAQSLKPRAQSPEPIQEIPCPSTMN